MFFNSSILFFMLFKLLQCIRGAVGMVCWGFNEKMGTSRPPELAVPFPISPLHPVPRLWRNARPWASWLPTKAASRSKNLEDGREVNTSEDERNLWMDRLLRTFGREEMSRTK